MTQKPNTSSEHRIINKQLMVTRRNQQCGWRVEANIYELVKAFLLWNYSSDMLPLFPPCVDEFEHPDLHLWYLHLSKPNPPQTRTLKVSQGEYREWLLSLDLSKPFDKAACDTYFTDGAASKKTADVDAIAIEEATND